MSLLQVLSSTNGQGADQDKVYGVVVALVRDIKDPKKLGRVKVDFPWLAAPADSVTGEGGEDRAFSTWARVASFMAGKGRGAFFIPEVDDEVLVAFEHGDLSRPIVIGSLWNADDAPPEAVDSEGKNNWRMIRSRSGHVIKFNDSEDEPSILIADKTGENQICIDSAKNAMSIKVKGDLSIEAEGNLTLRANGKIELAAGQDLTLNTDAGLKAKASGAAGVESGGKMSLKSSSSVGVEGGATAELKAASVTVNGSAMTEVKGGLVKIN